MAVPSTRTPPQRFCVFISVATLHKQSLSVNCMLQTRLTEALAIIITVAADGKYKSTTNPQYPIVNNKKSRI